MEVAADEPQDVSVADLLDQPTDTAPADTPPDAAPVADTGTEPTVETPAEPTLTIKDRVAELGFTDVADDNDAQARLLEGFRQERERNQQTQQQLEMLRWQMQQAQGQQPPVQQPPQTDAPASWFNAPNSNEQLRQQFVAGRAEDGSIQWKPNTPPNVIAEHEAAEAFYADWAQKLVRDPVNALAGFKQEVIAEAKREAEAAYAERMQRQQVDTFITQQIQEHEDVFYQKDPVTKAVRKDYQDLPLLTEAGVRFESILGELENAGVKDETLRWKYALQNYRAQYGDLKQQASDRMAQARAGHAAKTAATHIAPRNGQEVKLAPSGRREELEGLGGRMFSDPEFLSSLQFS